MAIFPLIDPPPPTYAVTWQDVRDAMPFDASNMNATTPITPTLVTGWIEEGAAHLSSVLTKDAASLDLDPRSLAQAREAIVAYGVMRALDRLGYAGKQRDEHQARWETLIARYSHTTQLLAPRSIRVESNVDTCMPIARQFHRDYQW